MNTIKLNITQLNTLIKRIVDAEDFLQNISVYGEVSNFKISAGNAYFDIKEDGAQIACIKFGAAGLDISNGDMVLITGRLNYYVKTGRLSFIANFIEPYGLGALYRQYLALKEKLANEGLFDERYKKQIPRYANNIGVITSQTGAVIRDIIHVATKKNPYANIIVYPAKVQGQGAEKEIIAGLRYFENTDVDLVIIARGGGSFEDLAPFNTEELAREIFTFTKPVISAVGHETDFSISDFVADLRAPTPSVAAEIAFYDYNQAYQNLAYTLAQISAASQALINTNTSNLTSAFDSILNSVTTKSSYCNLALQNTTQTIFSSLGQILTQKKSDYTSLIGQIEKTNPFTLLKKGYALVYSDGVKISNVKDVQVGQQLDIKLNGGTIKAVVASKGDK